MNSLNFAPSLLVIVLICVVRDSNQYDYNGTLTKEYANFFFPISNSSAISLEYREIDAIDPMAFRGYFDVKKLDLSNNEIANLPSEVFIDMHSLEELNLSDNKLTGISRNTFVYLHKLKKFSVQSNRIVNLDQYVFIGLSNLKVVCIGENPVMSLFPASVNRVCGANSGCSVQLTNSACSQAQPG